MEMVEMVDCNGWPFWVSVLVICVLCKAKWVRKHLLKRNPDKQLRLGHDSIILQCSHTHDCHNVTLHVYACMDILNNCTSYLFFLCSIYAMCSVYSQCSILYLG